MDDGVIGTGLLDMSEENLQEILNTLKQATSADGDALRAVIASVVPTYQIEKDV